MFRVFYATFSTQQMSNKGSKFWKSFSWKPWTLKQIFLLKFMLECKYHQLYVSVYKKRNQIVAGACELRDEKNKKLNGFQTISGGISWNIKSRSKKNTRNYTHKILKEKNRKNVNFWNQQTLNKLTTTLIWPKSLYLVGGLYCEMDEKSGVQS